MKSILLTLALVLSIFSISATTQTKTQWEYKTEDRCFDEGRINSLGAQGWELAAMGVLSTGGRACVFKRAR